MGYLLHCDRKRPVTFMPVDNLTDGSQQANVQPGPGEKTIGPGLNDRGAQVAIGLRRYDDDTQPGASYPQLADDVHVGWPGKHQSNHHHLQAQYLRFQQINLARDSGGDNLELGGFVQIAHDAIHRVWFIINEENANGQHVRRPQAIDSARERQISDSASL
jgi:hypothetical protein